MGLDVAQAGFVLNAEPGVSFDSLNERFCFVETQHFVLICCCYGQFVGKPQTEMGVKPLEGEA